MLVTPARQMRSERKQEPGSRVPILASLDSTDNGLKCEVLSWLVPKDQVLIFVPTLFPPGSIGPLTQRG